MRAGAVRACPRLCPDRRIEKMGSGAAVSAKVTLVTGMQCEGCAAVVRASGKRGVHDVEGVMLFAVRADVAENGNVLCVLMGLAAGPVWVCVWWCSSAVSSKACGNHNPAAAMLKAWCAGFCTLPSAYALMHSGASTSHLSGSPTRCGSGMV